MNPTLEILDEIEKRANAATPGPWFNGHWSGRCFEKHVHGKGECNYQYKKYENNQYVSAPNNIELIGSDDGGPILRKHNAKFIAESRTDIPKLTAALRVAIEALDNIGRGGSFDASSVHDTILTRQTLQKIEQILKGETK